jgi:hypothetical protein
LRPQAVASVSASKFQATTSVGSAAAQRFGGVAKIGENSETAANAASVRKTRRGAKNDKRFINAFRLNKTEESESKTGKRKET